MRNEQDVNASNNGTTRQPSSGDSGTGRRGNREGSGAADGGFGGGAGSAHEQTKSDTMDAKEQFRSDVMKDLQSQCCVCNTKEDKNIDLNDAIIQLMNQTFNIEIQSKYDKLICADCLELAHKVNGLRLRVEARKLRINVCESLSPVKDPGTSCEAGSSRDVNLQISGQQNRDLINRRSNCNRSRTRSRSRSCCSTPPTPGEGISSGSVCSSHKESDNES